MTPGHEEQRKNKRVKFGGKEKVMAFYKVIG